ncbi:unnamed protein product, partial [Adineta steineri]
TSIVLPPQCTTATVITDATRNVGYTVAVYGCDTSSVWPTRWYRFSGGAGTMLANYVVAINHCGTQAPGWYTGTYPSTAGSTTSGTVCYNWAGNSCEWSNSISITNCNGYYVFYLSATPNNELEINVGCVLVEQLQKDEIDRPKVDTARTEFHRLKQHVCSLNTKPLTSLSNAVVNQVDLDTHAPASCFYGKDQVELVHGEKRSIENLIIGDRVWSITPDGNSLIEDEIIMMMHNEPNISALFYTFKTIEGYEVSLTDRHNIPVYDSKENQIKTKRSSLVRQEDYLLMYNRKVKIENISINTRIGFYSPLTLTGYLLVNNISTSVFSDSYKTSSNTIQLGFLPIRLYYRLTRMIYGKTYNPF